MTVCGINMTILKPCKLLQHKLIQMALDVSSLTRASATAINVKAVFCLTKRHDPMDYDFNLCKAY